MNEKVNELRSKNNKLSNDLLNKEDELEEFKALTKLDTDKKEKMLNELRLEIQLLQQESKKDTEMSVQAEVEQKLTNEEIDALKAKLEQAEETNLGLINEIKQLKEKHLQLNKELTSKFDLDLVEITESKEKEVAFYQNEMSKLVEENEKSSLLVQKLLAEKRVLEEEVLTFNESKKAIAKYEWQMNEILTMLNDEKAVRSHLRALATKLIEEVETLKQRTTESAPGPAINGPANGNANGATNGYNSALVKTANSNSQLLNANITSNLHVILN